MPPPAGPGRAPAVTGHAVATSPGTLPTDGDEGLFASYADVQFRAPVQAGDIIEATAAVTAVGRRSRELTFEASVVCRADPERGPSAATVLPEPLVVATATGTVVVPAPGGHPGPAPGGHPAPAPRTGAATESDSAV